VQRAARERAKAMDAEFADRMRAAIAMGKERPLSVWAVVMSHTTNSSPRLLVRAGH
jgi:hypothetical protein